MVAIMIMKTLREQGKFLWFTYANIQKMHNLYTTPCRRTSLAVLTMMKMKLMISNDYDYERHDENVRIDFNISYKQIF